MTVTAEAGHTLSEAWEHGDKVDYRRRGETHWKKGTVRLIFNDAEGSVSIFDKHGLNVCVPNEPQFIRARRK